MYKMLKPGRWLTVEFHNTQNAVWNAIQEGIGRAGFVVADVRMLDKQQSSFKQLTADGAVKSDLVISAYKPTASFASQFQDQAGSETGAWAFIEEHLRHLPAPQLHDSHLEVLAERLRALLAAAFANPQSAICNLQSPGWSAQAQERLLAHVGFAGKTLDDWLRAGFFAQHCRVFHNRPFIWHIWDGRKDGFAALANYHKLDRQALEKPTYAYLGAWITRQRDERDAGVSAADGRLVAALELQKKLILILEGEPPYDIYVR